MQTFLFDLDGTLLDSDADLAAAANAARAAHGLPPLPVPDVVAGVGNGLGALLDHVLPGVEGPARASARAGFVEHYRAHLLDHARPHPGAEAVLAALGGRAGLVTNKPAMFTDPILEGLGWREHFGVVVCGDTLPTRKPDPAPLRHACAALGVERAVFVGDTAVDQRAAAAAGLPFVAVGWGRVAAPAMVTDLRQLLEGSWA